MKQEVQHLLECIYHAYINNELYISNEKISKELNSIVSRINKNDNEILAQKHNGINLLWASVVLKKLDDTEKLLSLGDNDLSAVAQDGPYRIMSILFMYLISCNVESLDELQKYDNIALKLLGDEEHKSNINLDSTFDIGDIKNVDFLWLAINRKFYNLAIKIQKMGHNTNRIVKTNEVDFSTIRILLNNECYRVVTEYPFMLNDENNLIRRQLWLKIHLDELQILRKLIKDNDLSYMSAGDELIKYLLYCRIIDNVVELFNSNLVFDVNIKITLNINNVPLQNQISLFLLEFVQYLSNQNLILADLLVAFIKKGVDLNQKLPTEVINEPMWTYLKDTFGDAPVFLILISIQSTILPELDNIVNHVLQSRAYNIHERATTGLLSHRSIIYILVANKRIKELNELLKNTAKINPINGRTRELFNPVPERRHILNEYPVWLAIKNGYWGIAEKLLDFTNVEETITEVMSNNEIKNVSLAVNILMWALKTLNEQNIQQELSIKIIKVIDIIISKGNLNLHQLNGLDIWNEQTKTITQTLLEKILPYIDDYENADADVDVAWRALETIIKHSYESQELFNTLTTDDIEGVELTLPDIEDFESADNITIGQYLLLTSLWGGQKYWGVANEILKTDIDLNFNTPTTTKISTIHGEQVNEENIILDLAIQDCNLEGLELIIKKMKIDNLKDMFVQPDGRTMYSIFETIGFLSIPALIELKRLNDEVIPEQKIDIDNLISKMPNAKIVQELNKYTKEQVHSILKDIEETQVEGESNVFSNTLLNINGNLMLYPIKLENSCEISDYMYLNQYLDAEIIRVYNEIKGFVDKGQYPNDEIIKEQVIQELNEKVNQNDTVEYNNNLEILLNERIMTRNEQIMQEKNIYIKSPMQRTRIDNVDQYRKNYPIHEDSMVMIINAIQKSALKLFPHLHEEQKTSKSKKMKGP